jgi:hypothetical protein
VVALTLCERNKGLISFSKARQVAFERVNICSPFFSFSKTWRLYKADIVDDVMELTGKREDLTEIPINETVPSWNTSSLDVPKLTLNYGLHKLVFRIQASY